MKRSSREGASLKKSFKLDMSSISTLKFTWEHRARCGRVRWAYEDDQILLEVA